MKNVNDIFAELLDNYPSLEGIKDDIYTAFTLICDCYDSLGKVLICGNGGSAADADHIVGELMKGFNLKRPLKKEERELFEDQDDAEYLTNNLQNALPAISLVAHGGLSSAFCNDVEPDMVFAQQVWGYAKDSPDILIALSTSGNSKNVVNAVKTANAVGIDSIGITGMNESKLSELCTLTIRLPETQTYRVQELTLPVYHALCAALEIHYFGEKEE